MPARVHLRVALTAAVAAGLAALSAHTARSPGPADAGDPPDGAAVSGVLIFPLVFEGDARRQMAGAVVDVLREAKAAEPVGPDVSERVMKGANVHVGFSRPVRVVVGGRPLAATWVVVGFPPSVVVVGTDDGGEYLIRRPSLRALARFQQAVGGATSAAYELLEGDGHPEPGDEMREW